MVKIKLNNLPDKVYMKDLSTVLGLGGALREENLNDILLAARCNNLPIYFDHDIYGGKACDGTEPDYDQNGNVIGFIMKGPCISTGDSRKTLTQGEPCGSDIAVHSYKYNNDEYQPATDDNVNIWLDHPSLYSRNFYCNKDELLASGLKNYNSTPAKAKKPSKQQQREKVFKTWLASKAVIQINFDSDYQTCYEALGEPTHDEAWKELQLIDPQLFSAGKDDFFKYLKFVTFKTGTGKGRNP